MTHLKSIGLACFAAALFALFAAGLDARELGACVTPGSEKPGSEMAVRPLLIF